MAHNSQSIRRVRCSSDVNERNEKRVHQIEYVPIRDLSGNPRNPRKHDRAQVAAIAQSIEAFGFNAPILLDKGTKVIAGHGRLEAARLCGLTKVPVVRLDHLGEEEARAYMLADNKLTDRSSWDEAELANHLKEMSELALSFDIEATGFELPEVDILIQSLDPSETADELDIFTPAKGPSTTCSGDVWTLGRHRIQCGSALDAQVLSSLVGTRGPAASSPIHHITSQSTAMPVAEARSSILSSRWLQARWARSSSRAS